MSKIDGGEVALAAFGIAGAVVAGYVVIQLCIGFGGMVHDMFTVSPERQAEIDKSWKDWETDPRNPKVAGQKCIDSGGYPVYSAWDSRFDKCEGTNNKTVNIEVNQ